MNSLVFWQTIVIFLLTFQQTLIANSTFKSHTIVDPEGQISDFQARFEMAKLLSHHKKNIQEALKHYAILREQKPHESKVLLEIARAYISQEQFLEALQTLSILLGKRFFIPPPAEEIKPKTPFAQESIVPPSDQISDDQARLELARVLSHHENLLAEAVEQYLILLNKKPDQIKLVLELSDIYLRQKQYQAALFLLYPAIDAHPQHADLLIKAAHAEQGLKHIAKSQNLLLKALDITKNKESVLLDYANILMLAGSFYKTEEIYRNLLREKPNSIDLYLNLAWTFVSSQRYEEAEGIYRQLLLYHPNHSKALEGLATLKILEKNFSEALDILDSLVKIHPQNPSYLLLRANTLYKNESYNEALQDFEDLASSSYNLNISKNEKDKYYSQALIGMGKAYKKLCQDEEARLYFQKAYDSNPTLIEAQFYVAGEQVKEPEFLAQIIDQTLKPEDLEKWANLYSENGMTQIDLYEAALKLDPEYFPAQIGLAEALSSEYRYEESIDLYLSLLDSFPDNSKIMIAIARVLSWNKQYRCSFKWYDQIIAMNPQDPIPRREKARVAYWGYFFDYSMSIYQSLLKPTVGGLLLEALTELNQQILRAKELRISDANLFGTFPSLEDGISLLTESIAKGSIYTGYERFSSFFEKESEQLSECQHLEIEQILIQYLPIYRIQKSVFLEKQAKALDWQNDYFHALPVYKQLAAFSPGNEEGLYSYAQDYCSLGLCQCSRHLYYHLLNLSPGHNLAKMALERNLLQEHPRVISNFAYWKERGSGQFSQSQIARYQLDEIFEWSPSCNFHLRFMQNLWVEHPYFNRKYYPAEGQTIEVDRNFNGFIKGSAGATRKNYFQKFVSRYTGFANVWFNVYDYFNLGIGFERRNEIYNYFSLQQGIQAKVYWVAVTSILTHYWNMEATYRHLDYNDKNTLDHVEVLTSYAFTDDPDIFKIILRGSYRNTAHLTETFVDPSGQLVDVIHPYWTPQNYYSNSITLQYRHNFAFFNYCEAPQRYIDIKITGEEDTARNPSLQILFEWKHEFMYHWGFEFKALIHQSKLWNAEGAWLNVYYRF